ncbi:hypothetical protein [Endozoicomonas lisbonensis]|uniref:ERCC4-type nuclease n=1 Tax=Endozoicomonas lisbonensis TaxID=3120522 RepID=A0ABV2SJ92_9GAMM
MTLELARQNAEHEASQQQEWQQLSQWLLLSFIPGLGAVRYRSLLKEFGHPEAILSATQSRFT